MATYTRYYSEKPKSTYKPSTYSDNAGAYASDIARARAAYDRAEAAKPGAYQSQYSDQMSGILSQLGSRKFEYDVNSDALFQQLKTLYNEQGKLAMQNTQGQAAALTGGYGNSYGVAASQQAYQQEQAKLYDRVPELYQLALSRYQQEGQDKKDMYSVLAAQEASDYGRYRDTVSDYENERAYREAALRDLQSMNQNIWAQNESNAYNANQQAWNNYWTAEQQTQHNYEQAVSEDQWAQEYALKQLAASSSGGDETSSTTNDDGLLGYKNNYGVSRYKNEGKQWNTEQYTAWRNNLGRYRTKEGICAAIEDAYTEGKITENQARASLKQYNMTEADFAYYRQKTKNERQHNAANR